MTAASSPSAHIDRSQILKAANSLGILGAGSSLAPQIIAMLCDDQASVSAVSSLIHREPDLYARVLRVANSPYYGQARNVATIERAFILLGVDAVRGIVAAACLDRTAMRGSVGVPIDMSALVRHSVTTAIAAQSLARVRCPKLESAAFIAGLLHNLGIAIQIHLDKPGVRAMLENRSLDPARDVRLLEAQCVKVGHEESIAVVFEAWKLPDALVAAVRHHHDPAAAPQEHRQLSALVNLGATLGLACGNSYALEPVPIEANGFAKQLLSVESHDLDRLSHGLAERAAALAGALA